MTRPSLSREEVLALPGVAALVTNGPTIIGIRGFFDQPNHNQRGVFDDAAFIVGPADEEFRTFNWNTDPTITQKGKAVLQPGTYKYKKGIHGMHHIDMKNAKDKAAYDWLLAHVGQDHPDPSYRLTYWAYRQAGPVTILRDGETVAHADGWPTAPAYIDLHRGGLGTSSDGCQTNPPAQWEECRSYGYGLMDKYLSDIYYKLIVKS